MSLPPLAGGLQRCAPFRLGLTSAFILAFGAPVGVLGEVMVRLACLVVKAGRVLLIIFGLHTAGLVRIPALERGGRMEWWPGRDS